MKVNQLKDKLRKKKPLYGTKNVIDERILIDLKEKAPLFVDGAGLTNN